jgi:hypothetical protein
MSTENIMAHLATNRLTSSNAIIVKAWRFSTERLSIAFNTTMLLEVRVWDSMSVAERPWASGCAKRIAATMIA